MTTTRRSRLTLEQLQAEPVWIELTSKQKKLVETFIVTNGDRVASVLAAYAVKSTENARILAYDIFASPRVVACLAAYFQSDPLETFKAEVRSAYRNKKLSVAQVTALELHAKLNGWGSASLPDLSGYKPVAETVMPQTARFHVGQRVTQRDDEGVLHTGIIKTLNADGTPGEIETVE